MCRVVLTSYMLISKYIRINVIVHIFIDNGELARACADNSGRSGEGPRVPPY
jgi:hypothetical protein